MPRNSCRTALVVLFAHLLASNAHAADEAVVVVTATRQPQRINELLADVSVIEREEIDRAGQTTLAELLAQQPGIETSSNGGPGSAASVFIRGTNAGHALVLVDGFRIGSATLGETALSRIPLNQIERIEIVRGPASAMYGSDAIGGVIQVFTRQGDGGTPRLNASAGIGSYGTREASAGLSGGMGNLDFAFSAGSYETDGFSNISNPSSSKYFHDRDGYRNSNFAARLGMRLTPDHELGATLFHSAGTNHYDDKGFGSPVSYDYRHHQKIGSYGLSLRSRLNAGWRSTLRAGHSYDDSTNYASSTASYKYRTEQNQFSWQNDVDLPLGKGLLAFERLEEDVGPATSFGVTGRRVNSLVGGWSARIGAHRLQADVRRDSNSQYGDRNTGLLAYGHQFDPHWRGNISFGTAFKAPTFNDLYYGGPGGSNNPNLRPESARNREAAIHYEHARIQASATYYDNRVKDLITWAPTGAFDFWGEVWAPQNVNRARLKGVTLAYRHNLGATTARASIDMQSPRNADTGLLLVRRSRRHGNFALDHAFGRWLAGVELTASGHRYDDVANTRRLGGYALMHLRLSYQLDKGWSAFARLNNVFDRHYELVRSVNASPDGTFNSYGTSGANLFIGLRYAP